MLAVNGRLRSPTFHNLQQNQLQSAYEFTVSEDELELDSHSATVAFTKVNDMEQSCIPMHATAM